MCEVRKWVWMKTLPGTNPLTNQPHKRPLLANCSKTEPRFIFNPGHYVLEQNMFLMSGFSSFWRLFCNQLFLTEKELLREVRNKLHLLYCKLYYYCKKTAFYVLKILKYMYKSRYSNPSMGLSFSIFHCHRWKDQLNTFASSDLPPN